MAERLESYTRTYYTTARMIKDSTDWLWVNPSSSFHLATREGAENLANLSNDNGRESGLNIDTHPYFVVKVEQTSKVTKVGSDGPVGDARD